MCNKSRTKNQAKLVLILAIVLFWYFLHAKCLINCLLNVSILFIFIPFFIIILNVFSYSSNNDNNYILAHWIHH
jgi:hypothetical protein